MSAAFAKYSRLLRYIVVGGGVALVYSTLTSVLMLARLVSDPTLASAIATLLTQPVAFLAHRQVTYADVGHERQQLSRFAVVAISSLVAGVGIMKTVDLLHGPFWVALVIGWFLIPVINFIVSSLWVFRVRKLLTVGEGKGT